MRFIFSNHVFYIDFCPISSLFLITIHYIFKKNFRNMRILFVISQLADFTGDAGLVFGMAESLQKLGHEILIITTDADPFLNDINSSRKYAEQRQIFSENIEKKINVNGIPVMPIHSTSNKLGMYCHNAKKIGNEIITQFDIVHIFSWYHHLGIVFSNLAQKSNTPYVFTAFASLQPDAQNFFKRRKQIIDLLYTKKMITNASALHAVGNSEIPIFQKLGADPKNIYMIENGVDLKKFEITNDTEDFSNLLLNKFGIKKSGTSDYFLHKDLEDFEVRPHTDIHSKLVTYLFYLPKDDSLSDLGTNMLVPKDKSNVGTTKHQKWEDFDIVNTSKYVPNSFLAFTPCENSYHAVKIKFPEELKKKERDTIRGFVFDKSEKDYPAYLFDKK